MDLKKRSAIFSALFCNDNFNRNYMCSLISFAWSQKQSNKIVISLIDL